MDATTHPEPKFSSGTLGGSPAVRAAAHRALAERDLLLSDYPHWEDWRRQARASKIEAVAHLDELLASLSQAVTAWGGRVLWAENAAQARRLILAIAREHRVKTVVKSKSMTTEEIELNPALAAAGLTVMETDLGEFIVQLAGHPPAHLTAPALHLDRRQIAQIFAERLGAHLPSNPDDLTRWATTYINPYFFEAQMGITGVNFATPDGTLILVENESNLRFTATLPKVHVAVMGLEKIVPRLTDVEVMLRLLPASATGQRLTALVHFIQGLKVQPGGKQPFYLVLLDNGRRRLAEVSEMAEALCCLRCGACLNICPIFQVGAAHLYRRFYPGAIGIMLAPYLDPEKDNCDLCTQCGACQEICPVCIRLRDKIQVLRRQSLRFRPLKGLSSMAGAVLTHPRWYRALEPVLRGSIAFLMRRGWGRGLAPLPPKSFHRQQIESSPMKRRDSKGFQTPPEKGFLGRRFTPPVSQAEEIGSGLEKKYAELGSSTPSGTDEPDLTTSLLAQRLREARSSLERVRGPDVLARRLAEVGAPLWLEDHPWLREVAARLEDLGINYHLATDDWTPEAGTVVSVGLGAIPETGSVLVDSGSGAAAVLAFRAHKQVILIPPDKANLSLSQALEYVREYRSGMMTWLTGPSRTADIEKILVLGAQGPVTLEIILYERRNNGAGAGF